MDSDFKIEKYLDYFGTKEDVIKRIDECEVCGSKLVFGHLPDYKNLVVQETARCLDCGHGKRKVIFVIN